MFCSILLHVTEWGPLGLPGTEAPLSPISCRCWLKKSVQSENCKLSFIWGQNEDCSLGDSTSDSSKKLLQRSNGGRQDYSLFWPFMGSKGRIEGGAAKKSPDTRLKGLERRLATWDPAHTLILSETPSLIKVMKTFIKFSGVEMHSFSRQRSGVSPFAWQSNKPSFSLAWWLRW